MEPNIVKVIENKIKLIILQFLFYIAFNLLILFFNNKSIFILNLSKKIVLT